MKIAVPPMRVPDPKDRRKGAVNVSRCELSESTSEPPRSVNDGNCINVRVTDLITESEPPTEIRLGIEADSSDGKLEKYKDPCTATSCGKDTLTMLMFDTKLMLATLATEELNDSTPQP